MDQILDLTTLVRREVAAYAGGGYKTYTYPLLDDEHQTYAAIVVTQPDYPLEQARDVIVMARVVNDTVIIEQDITDKPLVEELVRAGIPRGQIVLTYAGESLPDA